MTDSTDSLLQPLVSVIIPVYNMSRYLSEALDSVLSQTLKEIEIICINDGSTDSSLEILKTYANRDTRIILISRENKGVGISRNDGIEAASGKYIAFLDPDDKYPSLDVLEHLYIKATENNALICGGSPVRIVDNVLVTTPFGKYRDMFFQKEGMRKYDDFQFNYGFYCYIYDREMLMSEKLRFPAYVRYQDPPFMVEAMLKAKEFYTVVKNVYAYRLEHKTITWDTKKVNDLYNAFADVWKSACMHNLTHLKDIVWQQMLDHEKRTESVRNENHNNFIDEVRKEICSSCKVSVIMPVYNAAQYLNEAIESVLKQTHSNLEIICVNDGSTDNSLEILQKYATQDTRIKIIDVPNGGYGRAMNLGLQVASGKYIAIVEPDDYIPMDAYARLVYKAEKFFLDICKGTLSAFAGEGEERKELWKSKFKKNYIDRIITPRNELGIFRELMNTVTGIYRTGFLRRHNIKYNETPGASYQDNGFFMLGFAYANRVMCMNEVTYFYRQDNENSSVNAVDGKIFIHRKEYKYIQQRLSETPIIWQIIKPAYVARRMQSHRFIFSKMRDSLKMDYLNNLREEWIEMESFSRDLLTNDEKWEMQTILQSPEVFLTATAITNKLATYYEKSSEPKRNKNLITILFKSKTPNKVTYKFLGIPFWIKRKRNGVVRYCLFGIPIVKRKLQTTK